MHSRLKVHQDTYFMLPFSRTRPPSFVPSLLYPCCTVVVWTRCPVMRTVALLQVLHSHIPLTLMLQHIGTFFSVAEHLQGTFLIYLPRSLQMVLRVCSPSVKARGGSSRTSRELEPLFGEGDYVSGMVTLDPSCVQPGRLTVTVSGDIECFDPCSDGVF